MVSVDVVMVVVVVELVDVVVVVVATEVESAGGEPGEELLAIALVLELAEGEDACWFSAGAATDCPPEVAWLLAD